MKALQPVVYSIASFIAVVGCTSRPPAGDEPAYSTPSLVDVTLEGRLTFSAEGDVWVMNADGSGRRRLTSDPEMDFDPAWSPDGSRIAFRSHRDGNEEVYVMAADGSAERNLTNNPGSDHSPSWSPDGTTIAFASDRDGDPNEIYVMNEDGSHPTRVTDNPGIDEYPAWSPDGTRIAFQCTMGGVSPLGVGDFEICVINVDGTELVRLTDEAGESTQPDWAPDGSRIAFESNRLGWPTLPQHTPAGYDLEVFGDEEIFVMNADGSEQRNLSRNPREDDSFPAWSPDGRWVMFTRYGTLHSLGSDEGTLVVVPNSPGTDGFPDWTE